MAKKVVKRTLALEKIVDEFKPKVTEKGLEFVYSPASMGYWFGIKDPKVEVKINVATTEEIEPAHDNEELSALNNLNG